MPSQEPRKVSLPGPHSGVVVPELAEAVGYEHLLSHTHHEALYAGGELVDAAGPEAQLVGHVLVAHDGTGDELRKERDESTEADIVALYVRIAAVDVDGVAHGLEGVEGDADGQGYAQGLDVQEGQQAQRLCDEVVILEKAEQGKIYHNVQNEDSLGLFLLRQPPAAYQHTINIVYGDGKQHEDDENRLAPAVKHQVCNKKYWVAPPDRGDVIQRQHHGQVYEHK